MAATIDRAAKRYAHAAFELAVESGAERDWDAAMEQIARLMSRPDVGRALANSRVPRQAKLEIVQAGLADIPPLALNLARLLVTKGRTELASQIYEEYTALREEREGIARARAKSAVPLSEQEVAEVARRLGEVTGKRVLLETEVEPSLLGGLVIQIGDRLLDASTRARLEDLRESLVGALG